jgi:hypothetical protein
VSRSIARGANPEAVKAAIEFWKRGTRLSAGLSGERHEAIRRVMAVGDARVLDEQLSTEAAGFIPIDEPFPSGHMRPPGGVRCRCTCAYRTQAPSGAARNRAKEKAVMTAVEKALKDDAMDFGTFEMVTGAFGVATEGFDDASGAVRSITAQGLAMVQQKGLPLPGRMAAVREKKKYTRADIGGYDPEYGVVELNLDSDHLWGSYKDIAKDASRLREVGIISTKDVHHSVLHELGHFLHDEGVVGDAYAVAQKTPVPGALKDAVLRDVSDYAAGKADDFVAEVFVGLLKGIPYTKEEMEWYNELGGPKVP